MRRRHFIRASGFIALLPLGWLWYRITGNYENNNLMTTGPKIIHDVKNGISFFEEIIISRSGSEIRVFSSKCTHAGCRLTNCEGNVIICSCHGSHFDGKTGNVLKGPASISLHDLPYTFDQKSGILTVNRY